MIGGVSRAGQNSSTTDYSGELKPAQSLPILQMLSKVHPVVAVQIPALDPYRDFPHVCWMSGVKGDRFAFAPVFHALAKAGTKVRWLATYEVPYFCILAQPEMPGEVSWLRSRASFSSAEIQGLHELAIREIPALVSFIEERLNLGGKPSLGLDPKPKSLTLEGVTDYLEPRAKNVYLVADPTAFSPYRGIITSEYDRALHYGLTDEEIGALELAAKSDRLSDYTVLPNFFYEPYDDQRVMPNEIAKLEDECRTLEQRTNDPVTIRAVEKVLSIAQSAHRYNLGIFLDSV